MTYLTLGQLNIPVVWLAFFVAIFYCDFRNRKGDVATNKLLETLVYTYIGVWKLSYMVFSWSDFIKAPLSLLYFDGGLAGHLVALAVLGVILYVRRDGLVWPELWLYWACYVAVFSGVQWLFEEEWLFALLSFMLLLVIERKFREGLLFVQFLVVVVAEGFLDGLTIAHMVVLLLLVFKTKQMQYVAIAGVVTLVALLLGDMVNVGDVGDSGAAVAREGIDLPLTTGEMYRLEEQPQSLTVVNFFATWCPPCKAEMPHLQSFAEDLPSGVALVGVNLTERDDGAVALAEFMETYGVTYPIVLDETDAVGTEFNVMSIPTTVLLNAQGEELERIVGPVSEDALRSLVRKYE